MIRARPLLFVTFQLVVGGCAERPEFRTVEADAATGVTEDAATPPPGTPPATCGASCVAAGGTCEGDVCRIACGGGGCQKKKVRCPAGTACHVTCVDKDACESVSCGEASPCTVQCTGENACGDFDSDGAETTLTCDGRNACRGKIGCRGNNCSVTCANEGCKPEEVRCCASQSCNVNGTPTACRD